MSQGAALPREQVVPVVERIVSLLSAQSSDEKGLIQGKDYEIAGSYRRNCAIVNDLDVVVDRYAYSSLVSRLLDAGLDSIRLKKDNSVVGFIWQLEDVKLRIELYRAMPGKFAEMLLFGTGSGPFNIRQRALAKKMGMKLSQNGLFRGCSLLECRSEEDIFMELGMEYLAPEERIA